MPTSIPYDPSLVLGNVVHPEKMIVLENISALQAPVDAAEANLNSLITLKRSIDCTVRELLEMGTDTTELQQEGESVKQEITDAAVLYGKTKVHTARDIQKLRATIQSIHCDIESPVDYNRSELKSLPVSNNSMQINVQYFRYESNKESSFTHGSSVSSFVNHALSFLGVHNAQQMSLAVQQQINMQVANHNIAGTLVISISCTHRNASVFAPLIIDVDKALKAWNYLYPNDRISTSSLALLLEDIRKEAAPDARTFSILSGATYGSSLVGMVHILNDTSTISVDSMSTLASQIQEKMNVGAWMSSMNGEFGVASSFATDVKNMLSTQNIQSHCSLVTMGIIPSIKSNVVKSSVMQFVESDKENPMGRLAQLQGATAEDNNTLASGARQAITGKQMVELRNSTITASIAGLAKMEEQENSIIDINSMMTAMDDYIEKCTSADENLGVPINFYLKQFTRQDIVRAWVNHYYPNEYNKAGGIDDSQSDSEESSEE